MEQILIALKKSFSFLLVLFVSFSLVFGVLAGGVMAQGNSTTQGTGYNDYNDNPNYDYTIDRGSQYTDTTKASDYTVPQTSNSFQQQSLQLNNSQTGSDAYTQYLLKGGPSGTQANTTSGGNTAAPATQISGEAAVGGIASCAASIVAGAVSSVMGSLLATYTSTDSLSRVPTTDHQNVTRAGNSTGFPPSLDSIGYCILNAVLAVLTQATIDWINSGFDGNPAFVSDPEQFFKDLGDIETASFLQDIVKGTTGINICEAFRMQIVTGLAGSRSPNQFANQSRCTLDQIGAAVGNSGVAFDYGQHTSGRSPNSGSLDALFTITQNDQNNIIGATFLAQDELKKRLSVKQNTATLDLTSGRGFLSFKKCEPASTVTTGSGSTTQAKPKCTVTTPGSVIENQLNNRLSSGNNRLVLADKFDQIITALVDQLIKVALNQVLDTGETSGSTQ